MRLSTHTINKNLFLVLALFICHLSNFAQNKLVNTPIYFTENKGQVGDQFHKPRPDVLFAATDGQLVFHLKSNGLSYQQYRIDKWEMEPDYRLPDFDKNKKSRKVPTLQTVYRTDIEWVNCNSNCVIEKLFLKEGFDNYYTAACPNGAAEVNAYQQVIYKNIYKGIDLKWYSVNGHLKYDYIIAPGGDYRAIQLSYSGAKSLSINADGELIITTPLGKIIEQAPIVKQNNKTLKSSWKIDNNIVSFFIENFNPSQPLIIDPGVRIWGTYYGGNGGESSLNTAIDSNGNIFMAGTTNSNNGTSIATVGSHQAAFGGGQDNAYIAKFNSAGVRLWATYYGGPVREFGISVAVDNSGNSFLCGHSLGSAGNIVATPGSHQQTFGGVWDAFLVKFNNSGIRQWGTYYGDSGFEHGNAVATDASGNVYLTGKTDAPTSSAISTSGTHQTNFGGIEDAFLVKFNSAGVRQWGTYYGGTGTDVSRGIHIDASGNIFITGWTDNSVPNIMATPGSHQNTFGGGGFDAFVAKFNSNGTRLWGTQYGGNGTDMAYDCETDILGNIYMAGKTSSTNSISTIGSHQVAFGGGPQDAFIACFNSSGVRNWGTYYGGSGDEESWGCSAHKSGHVLITGHTTSTGGTVIATPASHQPNHGGNTWDCFVAEFDPSNNGARMWGSYYGGTDDEVAYGCTSDDAYHFYMTGSTFSTPGTAIATPGSHQPLYGGGAFGDAFLVKFYDCPAPLAPTNTTSASSLNFCAGGSATLNVTSTGTVSWYATPTSTNSLGTGTTFITPTLSAGIHTFYAEAASCTVSAVRTAVSITVNPLPNLNVVANPTLVCAGKNSTLVVSGAPTYTWDNNATNNMIIVTPSATTIYTVTGTSSLNCTNTSTISVSVYPLDPVSLTASSYTSCLTIFGGSAISLTGTPAGGSYSGPNVSGSFLNPTALGVFKPVYTYTNSTNGCQNSDTISIEVFSCLALDENSAVLNSVKVYPNPSKNVFTLQSNADTQKTISICDIRGRVLKTLLSKEENTVIDITDYAPGIYLLKLSTANGSKEFKLIKE